MSAPRIALAGIMLESNAFAPVADEAEFRKRIYLEGQEIVDVAVADPSPMPREMSSFVATMNATGAWEPVPLVFAATQPYGPIDHDFFTRTLDKIVAMLKAAGPVDGVFLANHGAMTSTGSTDPDGEMMAAIRAVVGPNVPILVTLDLHANISERMVEASTMLIGYLTNPHVDMVQRGQEAAVNMRLILAGQARPTSAFIRLPITPPSVTLLTAEGPYADMIALGQRRAAEFAGDIMNVSVLGGFVFSDTPENGVAIVVTARDDAVKAKALCKEVAEYGWSQRGRFKRTLTSVADAVDLAKRTAADPKLPAMIYSDAGDNPGGGGGGDTTELLGALIESGAQGVLVGCMVDPALAEEAVALGEGATFNAVFNRAGNSRFGKRIEAEAEVVKLAGPTFVGRLGITANRLVDIGPAAALRIGGATVVVISNRQQCADPAYFEHFGFDPGSARTVVVKSRGHFRAGFAPWFKPEQVVEVDTAGLTSPVLERFDWKGLPRPVLPLDAGVDWQPPDW
ncbi:MAG: M81 family metallopeptidase [Alphaproteobacteria bacterium]